MLHYQTPLKKKTNYILTIWQEGLYSMHMYVFLTLIYKLTSIIMTQYNLMHGC